MGYYGPFGGGGGVVTFNQHLIADEYVGPSSYPTGGFIIDLSKTYSTLNSLDLVVKTRGANLPAVRYEITLNSPSAGKGTVKIVRKRYDKATSVGNITNPSAPAVVRSTSGYDSGAESVHVHSIAHDHGSFASGVNTFGGVNVLLDALGPNLESHTHTLDLPNFTGNSGAGSSHIHRDDNIYEHQHALTFTATNYVSVELANTTNLSGTTWLMCATGVKA